MQMFKVQSSNIDKVGHDADVLRVNFKTGKDYLYRKVPLKVFGQLLAADSIGQFLNAEIKAHPDKYPYEPIPT